MATTGITTSPPSWKASWVVDTRTDTSETAPSAAAAKVGPTHSAISANSVVGSTSRPICTPTVRLPTTAYRTAPPMPSTTAGIHAASSLATASSRSVSGVSSRPSRVPRSFSPASPSAAITEANITGTSRIMGESMNTTRM